VHLMELSVEFKIKVPVEIKKRKKWVLASCPILDVHSQGETEAKAKKNLTEAIQVFLVSCFERGTLDAVLKDCGFKAVRVPEAHRTKSIPREDYINIPIPFLIDYKKSKAGCRVLVNRTIFS